MQKNRESRPLFLGGGVVGGAQPPSVNSSLQVSSGGERGKVGIVGGGHFAEISQRAFFALMGGRDGEVFAFSYLKFSKRLVSGGLWCGCCS